MTIHVFSHRKTGRILKVSSTTTMLELHNKGIHLSQYRRVGIKTKKQ